MYTIQVRQPPMQTANLIGSLVPIQIPGVPTRLRVPYERPLTITIFRGNAKLITC